jgi:hypothetical protein
VARQPEPCRPVRPHDEVVTSRHTDRHQVKAPEAGRSRRQSPRMSSTPRTSRAADARRVAAEDDPAKVARLFECRRRVNLRSVDSGELKDDVRC